MTSPDKRRGWGYPLLRPLSQRETGRQSENSISGRAANSKNLHSYCLTMDEISDKDFIACLDEFEAKVSFLFSHLDCVGTSMVQWWRRHVVATETQVEFLFGAKNLFFPYLVRVCCDWSGSRSCHRKVLDGFLWGLFLFKVLLFFIRGIAVIIVLLTIGADNLTAHPLTHFFKR